MNRLIQFLQSEDKLSEVGLKQLYRQLCKETHPDVTGKDGTTFVELKELYEEALKDIQNKTFDSPNNSKTINIDEIRLKLLKTLYIYSVKFRGKYSEGLLNSMIELSKSYNTELHKILRRYKKSVFIPFSTLNNQGEFYWTHSLFIQTIPQLVWYFNYDSIIYKRISISYIEELKRRASKLENKEFKEIFYYLGQWLEEEMNGEKVIILKE